MTITTNDMLRIAELAQQDMHAIGSILLWSPLLLTLLPPVSLKWRNIILRSLTITIVVWIGMLMFRTRFEVPWNSLVINYKDLNAMYDGVGGNAAWLVLGWIFPLGLSLCPLLILKFISWIYYKNKKAKDIEHAPPEGRGEAPRP